MSKFEQNKNQNNQEEPKLSKFQEFVQANREGLRGKSREEVMELYNIHKSNENVEELNEERESAEDRIDRKRNYDELMVQANPEKVAYFKEKLLEYRDAGNDFKRITEALEFEYEQRHNGTLEFYSDDITIWEDSEFPIKVGEIPHARAAAQEILAREKIERLGSKEVEVQFDDIFDATWLGKIDEDGLLYSEMSGGYDRLVKQIKDLEGQEPEGDFHVVDLESTELKVPVGKEQEMIEYILNIREKVSEKYDQMNQRIREIRLSHFKIMGEDVSSREDVQELYLEAFDEVLAGKSKALQVYTPKEPSVAIDDQGNISNNVRTAYADSHDMYKAIDKIRL